VLVANVVEMGDARGGSKGLDTALIRDHLHAATVHGRMAAAAEAIARGYAIEAEADGSGRLTGWRLAGIPAGVEELFSKRSAQIDRAEAEAGFVGHQARSVAARTTRAVKRHTVWRASCCPAGTPSSRIRACRRGRWPTVWTPPDGAGSGCPPDCRGRNGLNLPR
jgi:hypothetical protein